MYVVLVAQSALVLSLWASGFTAVSDDDAARVVISQTFAAHPSWDPSGTSWLPIPFLFNGTLMWFTEASLDVARAAALLSSLGACGLLFAAARILGASPLSAAVAVIFSASLPLTRHLAGATVPEYLTAACVVFAASTLSPHSGISWERKGWLGLLGGGALFVACGSRYEPWPASAAFAIAQLISLRNSSKKGLVLSSAVLASAFPLLWVLHGQASHGDPLFFVKRVVDYRVALGGDGSLSEALLTYPRALLLAEPEGILALLFASLAFLIPGASAKSLGFPVRAGIPLLVLLLVLICGAVREGAPTHHPERALLSCYLFSGVALGALWTQAPRAARTRLSLFLGAGAILGLGLRSAGAYERQPFVNRRHEEAAGRWISAHLPESEKVALALSDYGYFSVMAAAKGPGRFEVLEKHDPREASSRDNRQTKLTRFRKSGGCTWVEAPDAVRKAAVVVYQSDKIAVFRGTECPKAN